MSNRMRHIQIPRFYEWEAGRERLGPSFAKAPRQEIVRHQFGENADIIRVIMGVVNNQALQYQTQQFAKDFKGRSTAEQYDLLFELWAFCRENIVYRTDPAGEQNVKHPIVVYEDGHCDCKGMTTLQYHTVRSIGLPCYIEFASYTGGNVGHVYPVAVLDGQPVYLDAVYEEFDQIEPAVYTRQEYPRHYEAQTMAGIHGIGGPYCQRYTCRPNYIAL